MLVHDVLAGVVGRAHPWQAVPCHVHGAEAHACLSQHRCRHAQGCDPAALLHVPEQRFLLATGLVLVEDLGAFLL